MDIITNPVELSSVVDVNDKLVIDLSDSSTADGIKFGEVRSFTHFNAFYYLFIFFFFLGRLDLGMGLELRHSLPK